MDQQTKQSILEKYKKEKEKGVPFYPDILFKDAVVTLVIFLGLIALVYFLRAPLEARADPADTNYTPRPEWYFLFLFQLLKYFPGNLEVIGVVVLPSIAILALFALPFLDRSPRRHFSARPMVIGVTALMMVGVIGLSILSVLEAPPPSEAARGGDVTAALYSKNCAGCHGPSIVVASGTNLHEIIAKGSHENMPSWSADLTNDQIDALVGFILSPEGSALFSANCGQCHQADELVSTNPIELKGAIQAGQDYPAHADVSTDNWPSALAEAEQTALLNFLIAPDGQRLFSIYCSSCHGQSIAYSGESEALTEIIKKGGLHLNMPGWQGKLSSEDMQKLAKYVVNPSNAADAQTLFEANCSSCHGQRIPRSDSEETAYQVIAKGGTHETMPVWGDILTDDQIEALVSFTLSAASGTSLEEGRDLYDRNCSSCHSQFGEGGPNPARSSEFIAPISTAEFLKTRDDFTLRAIISQGQPNLGMSPFGSAFGGPLSEDEVDLIVAYLRSWEANPPVDLPPEVIRETLSLKGEEIFLSICAQCHGESGEGVLGPSLKTREFQEGNTDQEIFSTIKLGHEDSPMIAWGDILSDQQINQLVAFIRDFPIDDSAPKVPSYQNDIVPIIKTSCIFCHNNTTNGWDASDYDSVINSGFNGPSVVPGDPDNSLLIQKLQGTHLTGTIMPPGGKLSNNVIQKVFDWIKAGAPND